MEGLVDDFRSRCVKVYKEDANRVQEDAGKERGIAEGGYGRKQIQELVQNAADALQGSKGRIQVVVTSDALYVANEGRPFEASGVRALLYTHLSNKTGSEIGRFGLGFKSVSGISDGPQIFSQSVSFEFNRQKTAEDLSTELGHHFGPGDVPALRLAWRVDPQAEFRSDPILAELSRWAVTIVKVPLKPSMAPHLSAEIDEFDESFNLFAPHVRQLDLRDDFAGRERNFKGVKKGNRITLTTEDGDREWLVVSREHTPSEAALESAGHAARRESVVVSWALPVSGRAGVGQLAAFFPVKSDLTLSGRVNAPWKLSDDRINVIECQFNREILVEVVPQLVVDARKELVADGAFGRYIDVLPARGREERSWADDVLNEPVYQALRKSRCLPDLDGQMRAPSSMRRVPAESVNEFAAQWLKVAGDRSEWVHPDCTTSPERRSKVDRLMQDNPHRVGRVLHWLQSVVSVPTPENSAAVIEIAAGLIARGGNTEMDVRDSRIVLLENGLLAQPVRGRCFVRTKSGQQGSNFVDSRVSAQASTADALTHLGITAFEDGGAMLELLDQLNKTGRVDWDELWMAMRGSGESVVGEAFERVLRGRAAQLVHVRNGLGEWELPSGLYIAGECLKQLKEDGAYLVDGAYHAADHEILALLGVRTRPVRSATQHSERWLAKYRAAVKDEVSEHMGLGIQARENIVIDAIESTLGPLEHLPDLSVTNKVALTTSVVNEVHDPRVRVTHPNVTKTGRFAAPEIWWVRRHGMLPTVLGPMPVGEVFIASQNRDELEGLLPTLAGIVVGQEMETTLRLRTEIEELSPTEFAGLVKIHVDRDDVEKVGRVYAWWCLAHQDSPPDRLWVHRNGQWAEEERGKVAVVQSRAAYQELDVFGIPSVVVDGGEDVYNLRELWGCIEGKQLPVTYSYETSAEPEVLADVYDILDTLDLDEDPEELQLQKCLSISKVAAVPGQPEVRVPCASGREGDRILVTGTTEHLILQQVLGCLLHDNSDEQVDALLHDMESRRNTKRIRDIKKASTDAERLLMFAGEDRLRTLIPRDALSYLAREDSAEPNGIALAELCVTMHGVRALERVCRVDPQGLPRTPPSTWAGSFNTRKWVAHLGFGEQWAGNKARRRNKPTEYVDGPTQLAPLHDYQQAVSKRLMALLGGEGPRRGIISLPTGAGKTRVAVQTIVEAIEKGVLDGAGSEGAFSGPILWIADGEELCEQAIDAWSYLWRAVGRQDTQLILSRFWSSYEMEEESAGVQVVVATWNKVLSRAVDEESFAWLADAPLVVIDEAHGALHDSYTKILEWLGQGSSDRTKPLIGLTATPYRGRRDSDETQRLLRRFDRNILDEGVFGAELPQVRLQRDKVLARASLEILYGTSIDLSDKELEEYRSKYWLSRSAEARLGADEDRTRTIITSILSKPADWQIVVFAASVESAQTLATLLTLAGRPAASIDQDTSPEDRRTAIDRFKSRELKVLTNYAVLSQGFDAPKTDAVYITRPTSSEVRYMQMVGRGLRGPLNGGTDNVLIVNVLDNIVEFGDSIVYQPLKDIIDAEMDEESVAGAG
ncbi:DEAD/DEAH box helicase family protein [Rhodococcus hoagii]|nr:DEAD/DEAH box helicase family protein [Prescottella equi]